MAAGACFIFAAPDYNAGGKPPNLASLAFAGKQGAPVIAAVRASKPLIIAAMCMGVVWARHDLISATTPNFMVNATAVERGVRCQASSATWSGRATRFYPLWHCSFVVTGKLW
jgi:hypothetical protein